MPKERPEKCEGCGQEAAPKEPQLNPFVYEIHNEEIWGWWCDTCLEDMRQDI